MHPGDLVILIAYGTMEDAEARTYRPRVVFVDAENRPIDLATTRRRPRGRVRAVVAEVMACSSR